MSLQTANIPVSGMTCANCARTVERKLSSTRGVSKAKVDLPQATATVEYDSAQTSVEELSDAIETLGYEVPRR